MLYRIECFVKIHSRDANCMTVEIVQIYISMMLNRYEGVHTVTPLPASKLSGAQTFLSSFPSKRMIYNFLEGPNYITITGVKFVPL